jgi:hypothetical protein
MLERRKGKGLVVERKRSKTKSLCFNKSKYRLMQSGIWNNRVKDKRGWKINDPVDELLRITFERGLNAAADVVW